jgi:hypothetical protein
MFHEESSKFVNARSWRWLPGMKTMDGDRVKSVEKDGKCLLDRGYVSLDANNNWCVVYPPLLHSDMPDVEDAATVGGMLEVLHRATGMMVSFGIESNVWHVKFSLEDFDKNVYAASRADVLLAAFEAVDFGLREM